MRGARRESGPYRKDDDHAAVVNWMLSHRGVPKVVLIGSGFSRNAKLKPGLFGSVAERTPLWPQVTQALRLGLGYMDPSEGPSDALQVAEQYQESIGATKFRSLLLAMLKDDEISPGEAHNALQTFPAEAIITTNQLDTLLDRMEGKWYPVVECGDLPLARAQSSCTERIGSAQVIYLHGHRRAPETWIFSRSEYEDIASSRPAIVTRVQQLLSEYPLLVLGYSLSDPDFHALFRLIHNRLGESKPRALCVTVGSRPARAEKVHWLNLGMYLAHMERPVADDYAEPIAKLLRLEEKLPDKSYVKTSLERLGHGPTSVILRARLDEFRLIYDELETLEPSDHALAELYYESWKACFPGLDVFERDAKEREAKLVQDRHAEYQATGRAVRPRKMDVMEFASKLTKLPASQFAESCRNGVPGILAAVEDTLVRESDQVGVMGTIGEWIAFALEKKIHGNRSGTLGLCREESVLVELLEWLIEQQHNGQRRDRLKEVLNDASARGTLEPLLSPTAAPIAKCNGKHGLLPEMDEAWAFVWRADHRRAMRKYDESVRIFRRRGDVLGEWLALTGVIYSARLLSIGVNFTLPDKVTQIEFDRRSAEAFRLSKDLEHRRSVRRFRGRKQRIVDSALVLAERVASERSAEPGSTYTRFTSAPLELRALVCEMGSLRCHPTELRRAIELAMKLNVLEPEDGLRLGLQYAIEYTEDWLRQFPIVCDSNEQEKLRNAVCALVKRIADDVGPMLRHEGGALPSTYWAILRKVAPQLRQFLDGASAVAFLRGLLELHRGMIEKHGIFRHAFGTVSLIDRFASVIVPTAQAAAGQPASGGFILAILKDYVKNVDDCSRERLWQELADFEWGVLLTESDVEIEAIVNWLLSLIPPNDNRDYDDLVSWAESLRNAIEAGRVLGHPISESLKNTVKVILVSSMTEESKGRTQLALMEALICVDRADAERRALSLLERIADRIGGLGVDDELRKSQSNLLRWGLVGLVERGLVRSNLNGASPKLLDVLAHEVDAVCDANDAANQSVPSVGDEVSFVFVVYALVLGICRPRSREWLLGQVRNKDDLPISALGLCLDANTWGPYYCDLVAALTTRSNGNRLFETVRMVSNAVREGRYLSPLLRGEFCWAASAAVQQIESGSELISNGAAWAVMEMARQLSTDDVKLPIGKAICDGLRRCAAHSRFIVRLAVAFGLGKLAYTAKDDEIRELAVGLVGTVDDPGGIGLANDPTGMVRALVRYGSEVGRVQASGGLAS